MGQCLSHDLKLKKENLKSIDNYIETQNTGRSLSIEYNDAKRGSFQQISSKTLISDLNDDDLLEIFSYLNINQRLGIERVCKRWKFLVEISLRTTTTLRMIGMNPMKLTPNEETDDLNDLHLAHVLINYANDSNNINLDQIVSSIITKFSRINKLIITNIRFKTSPFAVILQSLRCDSLECLEMKSCSKLNQFSGCINIDDNEIEDFVNRFHNYLTHFVIERGNSRISDKSIAKLFKCQQLEELSLINVDSVGKVGDSFQYAPNSLKSLKITRKLLNETGFNTLLTQSSSDNLQELVISHGIISSDEIALISTKFKELRVLKIAVKVENWREDLDKMRSISHLSQLEVLHLKFSIKISEEFSFDENLVEIMQKCTEMRSLALEGFNLITDLALVDVARYWPNLEELSLKFMATISDEVMPYLAQLQCLRLLNLTECSNISDGVLQVVLSCHKLISFRIDFTKANISEATEITITQIISGRSFQQIN